MMPMIRLTSIQLAALAQIKATGWCVGIHGRTINSLARLALVDLRGGASITQQGEALLPAPKADQPDTTD